MWEWIGESFSLNGLIPHGFCIQWNPVLLWTLVVSDSAIVLAYFSIPYAIWHFVKMRPDIHHRKLFVLFGLFIVACGVTHAFDVITIWSPNYWANAFSKLFTAAISLSTAMLLWRIMPAALQLPSTKQLEQAKVALETLNAQLEHRVIERTEALAGSNAQLQTTLQELTALNQLLHREKALLRSLLDNIPDHIFIKDCDGIYVDCNRAFSDFCGLSVNEVIGKTDSDFYLGGSTAVPPNDLEVLSATSAIASEEWLVAPGGTHCCFETLRIPFRDGRHGVLGLIGVRRNITERKHADLELQLAGKVFSHAREGIMITDAGGAILEVNETFTRITGYSREEVLGKNPRVMQSGRHNADFYDAMWQALQEKGHWYGEIWNRHKSGTVFAEMLTISAVNDAAGKTQNYVALFTDITQMKEHQFQLEYIAHYDALTNLPNRVLLSDRLEQAMMANHRRHCILAVVYLDLDGFKAVNDSYDHHIGDELLIAVSQRMKGTLRDGDTLARIGGDEFVGVLVDLEQIDDCEPILQRLLQAAAQPVLVNGLPLQVSASIGVTFYPQDEVDADQLIRHADQAMYIAKQSGKNRYHFFDIERDAALKTRQERLQDIRQALDDNALRLYYQPKVNLLTGAVVGAEALIRWQHPERGLILPADFLPTVENHPLSVELGEWVICTALGQIRAWRDIGLDFPVSVNLGAKQFQQADFVARLSCLLAQFPDVPPSSLELEVLETSALEDLATVSEKIKTCREMGVRFALDDFGTGFSSLTYLRHLPVDTLKIDQSFIRDMLNDKDDLAIVNSVIGLADTFNRQVIAEGVETQRHAERLLALGCHLAQGYGIAKPMNAEQLPGWAVQWRTHYLAQSANAPAEGPQA